MKGALSPPTAKLMVFNLVTAAAKPVAMKVEVQVPKVCNSAPKSVPSNPGGAKLSAARPSPERSTHIVNCGRSTRRSSLVANRSLSYEASSATWAPWGAASARRPARTLQNCALHVARWIGIARRFVGLSEKYSYKW